MDKMKQWVALTVVGVIAVLAGGYMFLVSPKKSEAAELQSQAAQAESKNSQLQVRLEQLKAKNKQMPQFQAKLAKLSTQIPNNPALPALIRALTTAADNANVELVTMSPTAPAPYQAPVGAGAGHPTAAGAGAAVGGGGAAAPSAGSLQVITLSLSVAGGYFETENFFNQLEGLTRALKVTGFQMAPGANPMKPTAIGGGAQEDGRTLATSITVSAFMSPSVAPAPAALSPAK